MIILVRVDDRLLHGQIICAWVPVVRADALIVASDAAAGDELVREIMASCANPGLSVRVMGLREAAEYLSSGPTDERTILIVGELADAMKLYEGGIRFTSLNIGNVHHEEGGRKIAPSVIVNHEDEEVMEKFAGLGVELDIRDVPGSGPAGYVSRRS